MKKCTICDEEVEDSVKVCPNCGHNFNFKYDPRKAYYEENYSYENSQDSVRAEMEEKKSGYRENGLSTINIQKIKNRSEDLEPKIYELEKKNRFSLAFYLAATLLFSLLALMTFDSFGLLVAGMSLVITFLLSALFIIIGFHRRQKIVGDLWLLVLGINLFITVYFNSFWNDSTQVEDMSIEHTLFVISFLVGVGLSITYIIRIGKVFPLFPSMLKIIGVLVIIFGLLRALVSLSRRNFVASNSSFFGSIICMTILLFIGAMLVTVINDIRLFFVNKRENKQ